MNGPTLRPPGANALGHHLSVRQLVAAALTTVVMSSLLGASPASAQSGCSSTDLDPVLADAVATQGLPYSTLVRGKDALVRFYLMNPACANTDQSIQVTGASLNVSSGKTSLGPDIAAPLDALNSTDPLLQPVVGPYVTDPDLAKAAASNTSPSNPRFSVPDPYLKPSTIKTAFTTTFTMRVDYSYDSNGTAKGGTGTDYRLFSVNAAVQGPTASLRILTVPMGKPSTGFLGESNAVAGLGMLSRAFPVRDDAANIGTDSSAEGGILYRQTPGTMDISPFMLQHPTGKFCGTKVNSPIVRALLASRLEQNNSANDPAESADRVLGMVDTASSSGTTPCAEGMAGQGTRESWVRTPDNYTGALMVMESAHNSDAVSIKREDPVDKAHSINTEADAGTNRGYNLSSNAFLERDRTALRFGDPTSWNDASVLLEKHDWEQVFCRLGGPTTDDCVNTRPEGHVLESSASSYSTQSILVGLTDGSGEVVDGSTEWLPEAGTQVFDSYYGPVASSPVPASSEYRFVQRSADGQILSDLPVAVHGGHSVHDGGHDHDSGQGFFSIAYPFQSAADRWELWKGTPGSGTLLATRAKLATPQVTAPTLTDTPGQSRAIGFDDQVPLLAPVAPGASFNTEARVVADPTAASLPNTVVNALGLTQADAPLTIDFETSTFDASMAIGNGLPGTSATLTAYDDAGEIVDEAIVASFGKGVSTRIGVASPAGDIASIELAYAQASDLPAPTEQIDDLKYTPGSGGGLVDVESSATTEGDPRNLRGAFFVRCPVIGSDGSATGEHNVPVAAALKPYRVDGSTGYFRFRWDSRSACENGGVASIVFRASDGYTVSEFSQATTEAGSDDAPVAAIISPVIDAAILEHQVLTLAGQGYDHTAGVLPGDRLSWSLSGPEFASETFVGTGNKLELRPPNGLSWATGEYTVKLVVTDFQDDKAETTATIIVQTDADRDGIERSKETCYASTDDPEPDDNRFNAWGDADTDGLYNVNDPNPCVADTAYQFVGDFDPDTLYVPSSGHPVTFHVKSATKTLTSVIASSVRISRMSGVDVAADDPLFNGAAVSWQVDSNGVATAKFDRASLTAWMSREGMDSRYVQITLGGVGSTGASTWNFEATDTILAKQAK